MRRKPIDGKKWCIGCESWVPVGEFSLAHTERKTPSLRSRCRKCDSEYNTKLANRENGYRFQKYNTTRTECENFLAKYNHTCPICSKPIRLDLRKCSIDHSHTTNNFRGVLCQKCNALLGLADDNIEKLQKAIQYLMRHNS